jgi:hypothetical protein
MTSAKACIVVIPLAEFERMSQWGRQRLKAAIIVEKFAAR